MRNHMFSGGQIRGKKRKQKQRHDERVRAPIRRRITHVFFSVLFVGVRGTDRAKMAGAAEMEARPAEADGRLLRTRPSPSECLHCICTQPAFLTAAHTKKKTRTVPYYSRAHTVHVGRCVCVCGGYVNESETQRNKADLLLQFDWPKGGRNGRKEMWLFAPLKTELATQIDYSNKLKKNLLTSSANVCSWHSPSQSIRGGRICNSPKRAGEKKMDYLNV